MSQFENLTKDELIVLLEAANQRADAERQTAEAERQRAEAANQRAETAEKKLDEADRKLEGLRWVKNVLLCMNTIEIMEERKLMAAWSCKRCLLQSNAMQ